MNKDDVSDNISEEESILVTEDHLDQDTTTHAQLLIRRLLPDRRLDKYIRHRFPDFSRTLIQRLIKEQAVTVNDKPAKCSYQLSPKDKVDIILPPPVTSEITPEDIPLEIIYEDEDILVINKQANLIVHPARGNRGGTLVNGLVNYSQSLSQVNGQFRPGIVHRLDRNTTGVILIAKTDTAHWRVAHQFEHRLTRKRYVAVVQGSMDLDADVINMPLGRHPRVREKYAVMPETGKSAVTTYHVKQQYNGYTLLDLIPKTGRTHQLRVHTSAIKHPIVGDDMYGGKTVTIAQLAGEEPLPQPGELGSDLVPDEAIIKRQALHAAELTIRHPITEKDITFNAPLPNDMSLLIGLLERYRQFKHR